MLKTIKIDPPFFKTKNKTVKRTKTPIDMSQLKEKLQMNIQNRKNKTTNSIIKINTTPKATAINSSSAEPTPEDELTNSIKFMDKKVNTYKSSKSKSKVTIKSQVPNKPKILQNTFENIIENPDMKVPENTSTHTSYKIYDDMSIPGCLKNGKKKTFKAITNHSLSKPRVSFTQSMISGPSNIKDFNKPVITKNILNNTKAMANSNVNTQIISDFQQQSQQQTQQNNNIKPEHITNISNISTSVEQPMILNSTSSPSSSSSNSFIIQDINTTNQQPIQIISKTNDIIDLTNLVIQPTNSSSNIINTTDTNTEISDKKDIKLIDLPETTLESINDPITQQQPNNTTEIEEINIYTMTTNPTTTDSNQATVVEQPSITNQNINNNNNNNTEPQISKIIKKTIKKYKLGKNGTRKIVSVLCKNKDTIKNIKKDTQEFSNTSINKMKQYLINKTLLSVGSYAPDDVIKQMYVNAKLTGDIINHNDHLLLDNFITDLS